jgi:uncharacterized protein YeaO (DUF488 family)
MKTGYFARMKEYEAAGYTPVSIARYAPPFYHGHEYKKLAPSYDCLNDYKYGPNKGNKDRFMIRYFNELPNLTQQQIIKELEQLTGVKEDKIVLLCFEKPGDFCHRHLVADYLMDCTDYEVKEFEI